MWHKPRKETPGAAVDLYRSLGDSRKRIIFLYGRKPGHKKAEFRKRKADIKEIMRSERNRTNMLFPLKKNMAASRFGGWAAELAFISGLIDISSSQWRSRKVQFPSYF